MNQEEFFLAHQVDGDLTGEQMAQMLTLPEGDSGLPQSSVPDADAVADTKTDVEVQNPVEAVAQASEVEKPVVLAKDGVHTIPFEKLEEARTQAQHWRDVAAEKQAQLDALQKAPPAAEQSTAPEAQADGELFGDYSEEAIKSGVEKLVAKQTAAMQADFDAKLASVLEPIQKQNQKSVEDAHFSAITQAHPDAMSVAASPELAKWIESQPSFARTGYSGVLERGTAQEVVELLDAYKSATGKTAAATGQPDVAAAAQAAIAKAKSAPPTSLSEIPAGSKAPFDEAGAMLEMSEAGLMSKFDGKTPEQINALLSRLL